MDQPALLPLPEPTQPAVAPTIPSAARVVRPVRNQVEWTPRVVDELLPADHPARIIWACLERLDLSGFYASVKAVTNPTT